jgi:ribosomal protein S18 acetylase RimI-like enzyme
VDILLYDDLVLEAPDLTIPHPRMLERAFVMVPLAEIAPHAVHPKEGKTMKQLSPRSRGKDNVHLWKEPAPHPCLVCREDDKVELREMVPDDYSQVWRLWHLCKIPLEKGFDQAALERMRNQEPDLCLVAELNRVIIGVAIGFLHGSHGRVYNYAVDTHCRRRGIGSRLFREVEKRLRSKGASEIEATVPRESLEGRKFFEDLGFSEDERYVFMVRHY